ncbi:chemerin-like receptor 1 [Danio aesculapii]|uniref:chemerin-like receptor 1 n=1 Tax=Danio aesculapii TaxID=1142201 RepID=UPI0024BF86BD|nr:chemerin-like receptor 1 [Danio aesculapii]
MENTSSGLETVTGNSTDESTVQNKAFMICLLCIFFATIIVGLIGNGLVIFLTGCRMKTTVNSIWFLNLAIADFIYLLAPITVQKLKQSLVLVLETAFAEDHLNIIEMRQTRND